MSNIRAADICNTYFEIDVTRVYYSGKLAIYEDHATPPALKAANNPAIYCDVWTTPACNATNPRRPAIALRRHFSLLYDFLGNSSALSPFGRSPSDNAGYFYAISWSLVRYAIDRYATTESSFLTGLTQSTTNGTLNLSARGHDRRGAARPLGARAVRGRPRRPRLERGPAGTDLGRAAHLRRTEGRFPETYRRETPLVTVPVRFGTIPPTNYTGLVGGGIDYVELSGVHSAAQVLSVAAIGGAAPSWTLRIAILCVQ